MSLPNREQSSELLRAQPHVWNHILNYKISMSLKCAIQLGIPDIILKHNKPMTLPELVDNLPINKAKAHGVYRLMRILIHSGFFLEERISENEEKKGYWLTPASRLLLKEEPFSLVPLLLLVLEPKLIEPWQHIAEWFKDDHPTPFSTVHGMSLWDYASHDPKVTAHLFNNIMANDSQLITSVVIRDCKHVFEGLSSMVDLAGGTGTMAKAIADAFPDLKCTVLDLPNVVAGLEGTKNLSYVGGDMFESIPSADAILLKWILHNWSDEECVKILKKCKEAIPSKEKGGKLIIIDMIVFDNIQNEDKEIIESQLIFHMIMMVVVGGTERDEREWMKLLKASGFSHYKIINKLGSRSLIEVYPS